MFHALSDRETASEHAKLVGHFLYGEISLEEFGARSLSPGVVEVDVYRAGVRQYLGDDFLRAGWREDPLFEPNPVQKNHSWFGRMGTSSPDYINEVLRRLDHSVVRDDFLCVVALGNDPDEAIPPLMASAYNVLSVGCASGVHSRGVTRGDLDGPGRGKPDLVAPLSATSFATPVISSAAAFLCQCFSEAVGESDGLSSEVLRAALMAGADKRAVPRWERQTSRPFDPVFGAGQLRVDRSHDLLLRGHWLHGETESQARCARAVSGTRGTVE